MSGEDNHVELRLSVEGGDRVTGLEELSAWLREEEGLRGLVTSKRAAPRPGELGAVTDVLVATVGAGGTLSVLAASLRSYFSQPRRADVWIAITGPDGHRVEIDAKHVDDVDLLLRRVLKQSE